MDDNTSGYRIVPHAADLRVEAWAPTREECVAEAVLGAVGSFLDISSAHPTGVHCFLVVVNSDEDLLADVLDEMVYLLDTTGEVPVDVELEPADGGETEVRFATTAASDLSRVGAVPKGVSLHELTLAAGPGGWSCSVILDV